MSSQPWRVGVRVRLGVRAPLDHPPTHPPESEPSPASERSPARPGSPLLPIYYPSGSPICIPRPRRFAYLQLVPAAECRALFAPEIAPEMLGSIAAAIAQLATAEHVPWCAGWLAGLAQVGRLAMTVMMLDGATLGQLRSMFDVLEGLAGWKDEGSPSLRATFGVA